MKTTRIKKLVVAALALVGACAVYSQSAVRDIANALDAFADSSREKRELEAAPNHIKEIFALAKKSAEEDGNINFCGFFLGMSRNDAADLCNYYVAKSGRSGQLGVTIYAHPGRAVFGFKFTLKAVRSITKGGNTFDELAQAVANRVGSLKCDYGTGEYGLKTIDGIVLRMNEKSGLAFYNEAVVQQRPIATAEAAQKDRADEKAAAEESARKAAEAAEEAARKERAAKEPLFRLIRDMVAIPGKNFKMGKYEVTQAQWQVVMGYNNPSRFKGDYYPVGSVSWDDCKTFLEKLNARPEVKASGLTFRLPTEAEWEYACRAGGTGDYCRLADGTEITAETLGKIAWYGVNSKDQPAPVGQKEPNAFGLYDMHGNVWEWCEDLYQTSASDRVRRGGSWSTDSGRCAAGDRGGSRPDRRYSILGFRLAASQNVNRVNR